MRKNIDSVQINGSQAVSPNRNNKVTKMKSSRTMPTPGMKFEWRTKTSPRNVPDFLLWNPRPRNPFACMLELPVIVPAIDCVRHLIWRKVSIRSTKTDLLTLRLKLLMEFSVSHFIWWKTDATMRYPFMALNNWRRRFRCYLWGLDDKNNLH